MIYKRIAKTLSIKENNIKATAALLDEGNTIPFITRYRKEITGGLDEEQIQNLSDQLEYQRSLEIRKTEIIEKIKEQGKFNETLHKQIENAEQLKVLEDIYLPFRPKRRTRAIIAKEKGLEPLAEKIIGNSNEDIEELARNYVDPTKELSSVEEVIAGANDIVAENVSENSEIRALVRNMSNNEGFVVVKKLKKLKTQR